MKILAGLFLFVLTMMIVLDWTYNQQLAFLSGLAVLFIYWFLMTLFYEW